MFLQGLCSVQELAASPQPDVWALSRLLQFEARQVDELSLQVVALEYKNITILTRYLSNVLITK